MAVRLIIEGNAVYEIDEDCLECQKRKKGFQRREAQGEAVEKGMDGIRELNQKT